MPRFVVTVNGDFQPLESGERPDPAGISATRAVDGVTLGSAVDTAVAAVQRDFSAAPYRNARAVTQVVWTVADARQVDDAFEADTNLARINFFHLNPDTNWYAIGDDDST